VRDRTGRRRIAEVHVLERDAAGWVVTVPALRWGREAFRREVGWERLRALLRQAGADEDATTKTGRGQEPDMTGTGRSPVPGAGR
jgi:pilus assembly protein CpaF